MSQADPYDLERFVKAQDPVFAQVCSELKAGRKTGHWMWFIFPQIAGLGYSALARAFAITSKQEAAAYFEHAVLGPRLKECTQLVLAVEGRSISQILGGPDDMKFRSCMTLFARAVPGEAAFAEALRKYFGGEADALTLERL